MAVYSTLTGICAVDKEQIPKEDTGGKGYTSPKEGKTDIYVSEGKPSYRYTLDRLCKAHYLEAFAEVYPDADLPAI